MLAFGITYAADRAQVEQKFVHVDQINSHSPNGAPHVIRMRKLVAISDNVVQGFYTLEGIHHCLCISLKLLRSHATPNASSLDEPGSKKLLLGVTGARPAVPNLICKLVDDNE